MQYIFIHRVVQHFIDPVAGLPLGFEQDYSRWLDERSQRLFVDDCHGEVSAFRLLSPKVDPDLLPLVRHRERPEYRREVGDRIVQSLITMSNNHATIIDARTSGRAAYSCRALRG